MTTPLTFETTIDRTSLVNGCEVDWEYSAEVTYRVVAGSEEIEVLAVHPRDPIIGSDVLDTLSTRELRHVEAAARQHYEGLLSAMTAEIGLI